MESKKTENNQWQQKKVTNMVSINPHISIIPLNVNSLNIQLKDRDCQRG